MVNVKIKHLAKDQTWHNANSTLVVDVGRIVILLGSNPLKFKIGDGITQLQNLEWSNGTKTLAEILAKDNKVNGLAISSNNGKSLSNLFDTFASFGWFGTKEGSFLANDDSTIIYHDDLIQFDAPSVTKNGYEIATESMVHATVQSNIKIIGDWDATSGSYPLADESNTTTFITQWGATIKAGWAFRVGYGQAGPVGGYDYENGDVIYALVDNPTNNSVNWGDLDHNLQQANESIRGTAKIVTNAIIDDETTTDNERIVTAYKVWGRFVPRFLQLAWTWAAKQTFTTAPRFNSTTASQRLEVDSNKELISVAKGTADNKDFGTTAGTVCEGNDARIKGYVLMAGFTNTSPADATTYYAGAHFATTAQSGAINVLPVYIPKNGTIKSVYISNINSAATTENVTFNIRINNTTSYLVQQINMNPTVSNAVSSALSISVSAGDYFHIEIVCPTWATNPTGWRLGAQVYIE